MRAAHPARGSVGLCLWARPSACRGFSHQRRSRLDNRSFIHSRSGCVVSQAPPCRAASALHPCDDNACRLERGSRVECVTLASAPRRQSRLNALAPQSGNVRHGQRVRLDDVASARSRLATCPRGPAAQPGISTLIVWHRRQLGAAGCCPTSRREDLRNCAEEQDAAYADRDDCVVDHPVRPCAHQSPGSTSHQHYRTTLGLASVRTLGARTRFRLMSSILHTGSRCRCLAVCVVGLQSSVLCPGLPFAPLPSSTGADGRHWAHLPPPSHSQMPAAIRPSPYTACLTSRAVATCRPGLLG